MKPSHKNENDKESKTVLGLPGGEVSSDGGQPSNGRSESSKNEPVPNKRGSNIQAQDSEAGKAAKVAENNHKTGGGIPRRPFKSENPTKTGKVSDGISASTPIVWDDEPAEDPLLDTVLTERYRIKRRIGEGGMGVVYEAEHVVLEKRVALKVLSPDLSHKKELVERFLREAKAASRIGHENIVDITDFNRTDSGIVFFAMEYLDGKDLGTVIEEEDYISWERAKNIIIQICRALSAAHAKGIIHRDLKPENIFLIEHGGRRDFVKVVDFGIAKITGLGEEGRKLTKTGMIFGTPDYMSPEQASGKKPDHRIDIYALGVILYEMLTGRVPFEADSFMGILTKHMFEEPKPPSERRPDLPALEIPRSVESLIMKAMSKDREARFHSMSEFAAAIKGCHVGSGEDEAIHSDRKEAHRDPEVVLLSRPKPHKDELPLLEESGHDEKKENTELLEDLPDPATKKNIYGLLGGLIVILAVLMAGSYLLLRMRQKSSDENRESEVDKGLSRHNTKGSGDEDIGTIEKEGARPGTGNENSSEKEGVNQAAHPNDNGNSKTNEHDPRAQAGNNARTIEPTARYVRLTLKTSPAKARVYLDGDFLGETPLLDKKVDYGKKEKTILVKKKRYQDLSLVFVPDRDVLLDRSLRKIRGRKPSSEKTRDGDKPRIPSGRKKEPPPTRRETPTPDLKDPF